MPEYESRQHSSVATFIMNHEAVVSCAFTFRLTALKIHLYLKSWVRFEPTKEINPYIPYLRLSSNKISNISIYSLGFSSSITSSAHLTFIVYVAVAFRIPLCSNCLPKFTTLDIKILSGNNTAVNHFVSLYLEHTVRFELTAFTLCRRMHSTTLPRVH